MKILERNIEAIRYEESPVLKAYVNQLPANCKRNIEPSYQCADNCNGKLVIAYFLNKKPFSIFGLMPTTLYGNPKIIESYNLRDLPDLEKIASYENFELGQNGKAKVLYFNKKAVAVHNPCCLGVGEKLFSSEATETTRQLKEKVDELYQIAETKSLESLAEEPFFSKNLFKRGFIGMVNEFIQPEEMGFYRKLMEIKLRGN